MEQAAGKFPAVSPTNLPPHTFILVAFQPCGKIVITKSLRQRHISMWLVLELHTRDIRKAGERPSRRNSCAGASDIPVTHLQQYY